MKFRLDFVTNSSSSSYTCCICGTTESGFDQGMSELGFVECHEGHIICDHHQLKLSEDQIRELARDFLVQEIAHFKEQIADYEAQGKTTGGWYKRIVDELPTLESDLDNFDKLDEDQLEEYGIGEDGIPSACCPVCQMKSYDPDDLYAYLKKKLGLTDLAIFAEMKGKFATYREFMEYMSK